MKTFRNIIAAASVLLAVSCSNSLKEMAPSITSETIITATIGDNSKSSIQSEDGKVFWEPNDSIKVFCGKEGGKFVSTLTEAAASSQFKGTLTAVLGFNEGTEGTATLFGLYPYSAAATCDGTSIVATLPNNQVAKDGTFANDTYITVGKTNSLAMPFYGVCGGVRFTLTRNDIKSVSFMANNKESIAGKLTIGFGTDGLPVVNKITSASPVITLSAPEGETFKAGVWYYIVANPTTLAKGYEMIFKTADKVASKKVDTSVEIKRKTFGSLAEVDNGLEFKVRNWSDPIDINIPTSSLAFEINPVTKEPVIAFVERYNDGTKGPVYVCNGLNSTPSLVTSSASAASNQYVALGLNASGKAYVWSSLGASPYTGEVYSSSDCVAWTKEDVTIDRSNAFYGATIGCMGNEVFVMTSQNAAASGLVKRGLNVTKFNGASWATALNPVAHGDKQTYYPILRSKGDEMYLFLTNMDTPKGLSIYKYAKGTWTEVITLDVSKEEYKGFAYSTYAQDMAIDSDGQLWFAFGTTPDYGVVVVKINPDEKTVTQVGTKITMDNSISIRNARIGIDKNDTPVLLYRNDISSALMVTSLNDDWETWKEPEQLTSGESDDVQIRYNADGKAYIICTTTEDHFMHVFTNAK